MVDKEIISLLLKARNLLYKQEEGEEEYIAMIKTIKHIVYTYKVVDNFNQTHEFDTKGEARACDNYIKGQRKVLDYVKPKGVTLIISKDSDVYWSVYPSFIGYNGVPFCEISWEKDREHGIVLSNPVERNSSIYGNIRDVLLQAFKVTSTKCRTSFKYVDGAYHYEWNTKHGNPNICGLNPRYWTKGARWYNWDGKTFTTNDSRCKLTSEDFI